MVNYGMKNEEAIKTATINAAALLDMTSEIGTIETGKSADIIAVVGDPLSDIKLLQDVQFVMKAGNIYKD